MVYEKLFTEENPFTIYGHQRVKTSYFVKRKMPLYNKGTFDDGFYKVFKKNIEIIKCKRHRKLMPFALVIFNNRG